MYQYNKNRVFANVFDSIYDLTSFIESRKTKPGRDTNSINGDYDFTKTNSLEEAINKLKTGDEDLFKKVMEEKSKIKIDKLLGNAVRQQGYEQRIYGCVPNVPAFLKGNPINMLNREPNKISHKVLNIFLNIRVGGWVSSSEILKIGVKYIALIDYLEKNGYRCNLYSGIANESHNCTCSYLLLRVKTDREPLNIKKMCFAMAHPSMQRRIKFRWQEVNDCEVDFTREGYGSNVDSSEIKKHIKKIFNEDFLIWSFENIDGNTSIEKLIQRLKADGVEIEAVND